MVTGLKFVEHQDAPVLGVVLKSDNTVFFQSGSVMKRKAAQDMNPTISSEDNTSSKNVSKEVMKEKIYHRSNPSHSGDKCSAIDDEPSSMDLEDKKEVKTESKLKPFSPVLARPASLVPISALTPSSKK